MGRLITMVPDFTATATAMVTDTFTQRRPIIIPNNFPSVQVWVAHSKGNPVSHGLKLIGITYRDQTCGLKR